MMGSDYYDRESIVRDENGEELETVSGQIPLGIGNGSYIEGAILDKNVRIGRGVTIRPFPRGTEIESELYAVHDGIVVIPKNTTLPHGIYIGPKPVSD